MNRVVARRLGVPRLTCASLLQGTRHDRTASMQIDGLSVGGVDRLRRDIVTLQRAALSFVSVAVRQPETFESTLGACLELQAAGIPTVAHVTTTGRTDCELDEIVTTAAEAALEGILAVHGGAATANDKEPGPWPTDLVTRLKTTKMLALVGVDIHRLTTSKLEERVLAKIAASDLAITQMIFNAADYERLLTLRDAYGASTPVLPGIFLPGDDERSWAMIRSAGARVPRRLALARHSSAFSRTVLETTRELLRDLRSIGVTDVHFFVNGSSRGVLEAGVGLAEMWRGHAAAHR